MTIIGNILTVIGLLAAVTFFAISAMIIHDNYKEHLDDRNWMEIEFDKEDKI